MMEKKENTSPPPGNPSLLLWIVWGALTSSIVVYLVVLQVAAPKETDTGGGSLAGVLAAVSVVNLVVSFGARWFLQRIVKNGKEGESIDFSRVLTLSIISWALAESVAIYGLVLGFTGEPFSVYSGFFIAGFIAMVTLAPTFVPLKLGLKS